MKMFYILMFVSLWLLGGFFLFNRKKVANIWITLTILLGSSASYAFAMHLSIMPVWSEEPWLPQIVSRLLYLSTVVAMHIYFYTLPFVFCMGGLWLGGYMALRTKRGLSILLALGVFALLADHLMNEPWNSFDLDRFRWWDGIYIVLGCVFYYLAYVRERDPAVRSGRRRALLIPVVLLWAYTSDYLGFDALKMGWWSFDLKSNGMWQANFVVILGAVVMILFYTARYGFLGIKLKIERERLDHSLRTLTMGVSILNHSIKNEIQKIDYLAEKCSSLLRAGQNGKAAQTIEQVHGLTHHLLHMVNRIKEKAEDVELDESEQDVHDLVDSILDSARTLVENKPVVLSASHETDGLLLCDPVHVREMLSNMIRNALDALPNRGGAIALRTSSTRREFRIEVKDNGAGIPQEHLTKIFEPFFTTKKNAQNYGLGLSYCTSVMNKHGGNLTVVSEPGKGTVLVLHFPRYRFKARNRTQEKMARERHGMDHLNLS